MKKRYIIIAILVIAGLFTGILLRLMINNTQSFNQNNLHNGGLIHGTLHIVVTDKNGNIKYNITHPMDSPTLWFARMFALVFSNPGQVSTTALDQNGNNITIGIYNNYYTFTDSASDVGCKIQMGFGNATNPSYDVQKYNLDSRVGNGICTYTASYIGGDNKLHWYIFGTASYNYLFSSSTSSENITEIGVFYVVDAYDATDNNYYAVMIIYDPLSTPLTLNPGDTISVTYDIAFG